MVCFFFTMDVGIYFKETVRRTCSGSEHFFVWPEHNILHITRVEPWKWWKRGVCVFGVLDV
jgi:hypothetical protein